MSTESNNHDYWPSGERMSHERLEELGVQLRLVEDSVHASYTNAAHARDMLRRLEEAVESAIKEGVDTSKLETLDLRLAELRHEVAIIDVTEPLDIVRQHLDGQVIKKSYINHWIGIAQKKLEDNGNQLGPSEVTEYERQLKELKDHLA